MSKVPPLATSPRTSPAPRAGPGRSLSCSPTSSVPPPRPVNRPRPCSPPPKRSRGRRAICAPKSRPSCGRLPSKPRLTSPKESRHRIEQRADEGGRRDRDDPGNHDVVGYVPAHRRDPPRSTNPDDGARDRVRGGDRDAEPGRGEQRNGPASLRAEALERPQ